MTSFQEDKNGLMYALYLPSQYSQYMQYNEPNYKLIDSVRPNYKIRVLSEAGYKYYKDKYTNEIEPISPLVTDYRMDLKSKFISDITQMTGTKGLEALKYTKNYDEYTNHIRDIDNPPLVPTPPEIVRVPLPDSQTPPTDANAKTLYGRLIAAYNAAPEYIENAIKTLEDYGIIAKHHPNAGRFGGKSKTHQNRKQRKSSRMRKQRTRKSKN